jgi:hypothetical protein
MRGWATAPSLKRIKEKIMSRSTMVNNPNSVILVDNISNGAVCLTRENNKDLILEPGATGQISWAEYVKFKSIPYFGRHIDLNDSVIISNGKVMIRNVQTDLNDDLMTDVLFQSLSRIKDFASSLNEGEKFLFSEFLTQRQKLGIEEEKCEVMIEYLGVEEDEEDEVVEEKESKKGRGRPKKDKNAEK